MRVIYMIHNDSIEFETVAKLLGIYKIYKIYKKKNKISKLLIQNFV